MRFLIIIVGILIAPKVLSSEAIVLSGLIQGVKLKGDTLYLSYAIENKLGRDVDILAEFDCPAHPMIISNIFDVTKVNEDGDQENLEYIGPHFYLTKKQSDITVESNKTLTCNDYWVQLGYPIKSSKGAKYIVKFDIDVTNGEGEVIRVVSDDFIFKFFDGRVEVIK